MKKRNRYLLAGAAIAIMISGVLYYNELIRKSSLRIDSFMKNVTWNIDMQKDVAYRQGDKLEYLYFITGEDSIIDVYLDSIYASAGIEEIHINGKKSSEKDLKNLRISKDSPTYIKIIGKAKKNKDSGLVKETIKTEIVREIEAEESKPEKVKDMGMPADISFNSLTFSSNLNNLLEIKGRNLKSIRYIMIGEKSFSPIIDSDRAYLSLPARSFATGDYFILMQLYNGNIIPAKEKIGFSLESGNISIGDIAPKSIRGDADSYVVLQGNGFKRLVSVQLSNNVVLKNTQYMIINDKVLAVKIPKGLSEGAYHFNLMDTAGIYESKSKTLTINN